MVGYKSDIDELRIISAILRGVDVTEVFSPERVVEACRKHNLVKGDSLDLRTGYDLSSEVFQRQVLPQIESTTAQLIICSPPCTKLSRLQALNLYLIDDAWRIEFEKERLKAIKHIDFCFKLCKVQHRRGR